MSHPNKFIVKNYKMKKYIQIESFNTVSFSPIFKLNCSLSGPEKEGGRVDGLDGLRFVIVPQLSCTHVRLCRKRGDLKNLKIFG